jgi:DNA polymerase I - 3''-5'' exonuclease and polymerase domains
MDGFTIIKTSDQLQSACALLRQSEAIGLDCETTDLDPHLGRLRLTQLSNDNHTYIIDHDRFEGACGYEPLKRLLEDPKPRTVCHNGKYEQKWLGHKLGIQINGLFDSMLATMLIKYSPGSHNLETAAKTYLDITLDKSLQTSDWSGELSQEQFAYAARDAQVLLPLRRSLIERLALDQLLRVAQLEFEAVPAFASIELAGFYLDQTLWAKQLQLVSSKHAILASELQQMISAGACQATLFGESNINLGSYPQVAAALREMGVPIYKGTRNTDLVPLRDQYPVVAKLLEYRTVDKALTSYGQNWLDAVNKDTSRIYPDFSQIGAPTGRASCADPNVQQVPHGDEYRGCFIAPEGRKLCIVDYSQIELRILAQVSKDPAFVRAFQSGADLHRTTAAQVFNISVDQVTKEQRDFAKRLNFGVVYGIGALRLAKLTRMNVTDARAMLHKYFRTYRTLDEYLRASARQALDKRYARTLSGRMVRYTFDPKDEEAVAAVKRAGRNAPIQGTSADILKRALRLVHNELKNSSALLVNVIHDELVIECDDHEAREIATTVTTAMADAASEYIKEVPVLAEPTIATSWIKN